MNALPPAGQGPVPSPCVNVCRMNAATGLCEGCLRSLDEIAAWSQMPDAAKRVVWQRLAERRAAASQAKPAGSGGTADSGGSGARGAPRS